MKLKGKLILSCAALAAVATTAFSTTYAWYTSNDTVTATGLKANTKGDASDALQISLDGTKWGTTVDISEVVPTTTKFLPVARTAGASNAVGTFNLQGSTDDTPGSGAAATSSSGIVQFALYFRNVTVASSVYLNDMELVNLNAGGVDSKLLADIGTYKIAENSTYTVDLLRALDVEIQVAKTKLTEANAGKAVVLANCASTFTDISATAYNLEGFRDTTKQDTLDNSKASGFDALDYYNAVKGASATRASSIVDPATDLKTAKGTLKLSDTAVDEIIKVTYTFYLDGWDKACFDACMGQEITARFTFTTKSTS